ncbi:hypothetical protein Droror1_Dr00008562 [Drosera rotundifolia]
MATQGRQDLVVHKEREEAVVASARIGSESRRRWWRISRMRWRVAKEVAVVASEAPACALGFEFVPCGVLVSCS